MSQEQLLKPLRAEETRPGYPGGPPVAERPQRADAFEGLHVSFDVDRRKLDAVTGDELKQALVDVIDEYERCGLGSIPDLLKFTFVVGPR